MLGSRFSMWMAWGTELTFFCNDAYRRDTLGSKYPWALGRRSDEVWSEIWPDIGPRIDSVITTGEATWDEALLLFLERSGYQEETYHTFSYSPITDDDGQIAGMLCVVSEDTARVIGERRMTTLRDLGTGLARASTTAEVSAAASRQLGAGSVQPAVRRRLPVRRGRLDRSAGLDGRHRRRACGDSGGRPARRAAAGVAGARPARRSSTRRRPLVRSVRRPADRRVARTARCARSPCRSPSRASAGRSGFMVVGLNRYRPLDEAYRGFLDLIASQIAAAVTRARAFDEERQRAEELAELDRAKTTFFTNVSHELRTPLTLLLGPAEDALADTSEPLPSTQRNRLEVIQRNGERLLKLVNTLLDFSRMASGSAVGRFEPLDLARYTAELASMFDSAMRRAGLEFTIEARPLERAGLRRCRDVGQDRAQPALQRAQGDLRGRRHRSRRRRRRRRAARRHRHRRRDPAGRAATAVRAIPPGQRRGAAQP